MTSSPAIPVDARPAEHAYAWFIGGVASWFFAYGLQNVIFSWLVVGVLNAPSEWVGVALSCLMAPAVAFMLIGGLVADRGNRRGITIYLNVVAAALSVALVTLVTTGMLSLPRLLGYALAMGTVSAFMMPARDALLSDVAGRNMMRAVAGMTMAQWGVQALGAAAGAGARFTGVPFALALQAGAFLVGAIAMSRLPRPEPAVARPEGAGLADIVAGLREVYRSPVLFPVTLLAFALGLLFIGPFTVVFPLLVRDYYGGSIGELGVLSAAFPVGTIVGSIAIVRLGGIRWKGSAQLAALLGGSAILGAMALGLPFVGAIVCVLLFGVCGAVFMNSGRAVVQEHAAPTHRGRVLSVYAVASFGTGGVVGAPLAGVVAGLLGPLGACALAAVLMVILVGAIAFSTDVRQIE